MDTEERLPITDSPWFWVLMFSLMGLAALAAIHNKYGQRQAGIERQYQARERVARGIAIPDPAASATTPGEDAGEPRPYSMPGENLIPLWPLAVVIGAVVVFAAVMLRRERQIWGRGRPGSPGDLAR